MSPYILHLCWRRCFNRERRLPLVCFSVSVDTMFAGCALLFVGAGGGGARKVIHILLKFDRILPRVWNADIFARGVKEDGEGLDDADKEGLNLPVLTSAIQSPWFWGFMRMLASLHIWTAELESWAESCPCHDFLKPLRSELDVVICISLTSVLFCGWVSCLGVRVF